MQKESIHLLDEGEALLDVLLELRECSIDELLFMSSNVAEVVDLRDTAGCLTIPASPFNALNSKRRRRRIRHVQRRGPRAILASAQPHRPHTKSYAQALSADDGDTGVCAGSVPAMPERKRAARTTSRVMPKKRAGS
ncbi:hypothetical protein M422DRAFT_255503 [Sphaerobolus stellatus SS14]|uniref:Uncharacterized protein n=1 Tax=Sphaerobolus stellatus (strain SS14) TaxID=990650 RepID=A0A0C9UEZ1_SPHS4|nr:hypothetical protein M422DRAFT_255503 [Sphaerobolus stellatus SS14]